MVIAGICGGVAIVLILLFIAIFNTCFKKAPKETEAERAERKQKSKAEKKAKRKEEKLAKKRDVVKKEKAG
jgi:uncharacterized protein YlxW (UPF0749 family)